MAYARKTPQGRFRGIAKSGRDIIGTKTFDRKRDALEWAERQEAAASGVTDAKAGRTRLKICLEQWLEERQGRVTSMTYDTDKAMVRIVPASLLQRQVNTITPRDIEKWYRDLRKHGYSDGSIKRFRASLSTFFTWAVRDGRISIHPVAKADELAAIKPPDEMKPFTEAELHEVAAAIAGVNERLSKIVLVLGWTGLRWGEMRAMKVRDVQWGKTPALLVRASHSEHADEKVTKSGKDRRVPIAAAVLPIVKWFAANKKPDEYLFTGARGGQLWRQAFRIGTHWDKLGRSRRLHDLRHTAACLWIARGVDLSTVQAWMGHASITTTNRYLHYMGTSADEAGLAKLNDAGGAP